MRFDSLTVRGVGPFKNETRVDLSAIDGRLVAVVGENGAGKSTFLELLAGALFRDCPTRGPLSGLAISRDAFVEVACVNGSPWRIRQTVDAVSGKGESSVIDAAGAPVLTSAKVREYDAWAAAHLPSPDVLYASAFAVQGRGGFLDLRPAERKGILLRVLGIERLEAMARTAGERVRETRQALELLIARASETGAGVASVGGAEAELGTQRIIATHTDRCLAEARAAVDRAREESAAFAALQRAGVEAIAARAALAVKLSESRGRLADLELRAANNRSLLERADELRAAARRVDELRASIARLQVEFRAADERVAAANVDDERLARDLRDVEARRRGLAQRVSRAEDVLRGAEAVRVAAGQLEELAAQASAAEATERAAYAEIARLRDARVAGAEERITKMREGVKQLSTWRADAHAYDEDVGNPLRDFDEDTVEALEREAAGILRKDDDDLERAAEVRAGWKPAESAWSASNDRLNGARESLRVASDRAARLPVIEAAEREREALEAERAELDGRAATLVAERDAVSDRHRMAVAARAMTSDVLGAAEHEIASVERIAKPAANLDAAEGRLAELEPQIERAQDQVRALLAEHDAIPAPEPLPPAPQVDELERAAAAADDNARRAHTAVVVAEQRLEAARAAAARLAELDAERATTECDLADWTRVAADLGRDGLQAMEIDAAGPELSAMINDLLHSCVSSRWTVTIDTTRMSSDGKRVLEGLEVRVLDTERGREAPVETFSGGERVLIGEAVSLALSMLASRRAGLQGVTLVRDESGAALDPANARAYVAMLRRAADLVGASRVLLVSHSPEVVEMCDARIVVAHGTVEVQS